MFAKSFLATTIGLRYSYARRGSNFIALNAILSIIGIAIGIAALIVVLSVMNGVMSDVRSKLLSMTSHVSLRPIATPTISPQFDPSTFLNAEKSVLAYAPLIQGQGLIGNGKTFEGLVFYGVQTKWQNNVSTAFRRIDEAVKQQLQDGSFNVIIGEGLARDLNVAIGDKITVIVPQVTTSVAGILPRLKRFTLIGTFSSGHHQFDHGVVFMAFNDARTLLQLPLGATVYQVMLDDALKAPKVRESLNNSTIHDSGVFASDWSLDQRAYFSAVQTEKNAMFIILCLIVMVAAFGLLSSMYMVVTEKRADIAILRTMGMTRGQIRQIFLTQGIIFGTVGTVLGVTLGIILSINVPEIMNFLERQTGYHLPSEMYLIDQLSAQIDPQVVVAITAVTFFMTLIFSVIPAQIAAKTEPARALSYE